jgi:hypothetical protein
LTYDFRLIWTWIFYQICISRFSFLYRLEWRRHSWSLNFSFFQFLCISWIFIRILSFFRWTLTVILTFYYSLVALIIMQMWHACVLGRRRNRSSIHLIIKAFVNKKVLVLRGLIYILINKQSLRGIWVSRCLIKSLFNR